MEGGRKKKGKKREEKEVQRTFHPSGQDFSRLLRLIALCWGGCVISAGYETKVGRRPENIYQVVPILNEWLIGWAYLSMYWTEGKCPYLPLSRSPSNYMSLWILWWIWKFYCVVEHSMSWILWRVQWVRGSKQGKRQNTSWVLTPKSWHISLTNWISIAWKHQMNLHPVSRDDLGLVFIYVNIA